MTQPWIARIALCLVAASALVGCGKASPTAQPLTIDSVFTRTPSTDAKQVVVQQQKDRADAQTDDSSTHDVGGTGSDKKSGG
jgi:hypothetical protein